MSNQSAERRAQSGVTPPALHATSPFRGGNDSEAVIVTPEALSAIVKELIAPVMETIGRMLENNTEAIERLSSAQQIQNDRLEALEKQIRLQTPVTSKQAAYINDAIRQRARELLDKKGITDEKAIRKLSNQIRKAVLMRYGVAGVREIPKHEYNVAINQVNMWNDMLVVRDIVKEFRTDTTSSTAFGGPPSPEGKARAQSAERLVQSAERRA